MAGGERDPLACPDSSQSPEGVFRGSVYHIPLSTSRLPDFDALTPVSTFCTTGVAVTTREGHRGFPGVTERFEWFAVDYKAAIRVTAPGEFRFRLTSDDGAKLFINGVSVIEMDGQHGSIKSEGKINLAEGKHALRLSYFQGPGDMSLILEAAKPNEPFEVLRADKPLEGPRVDVLPASTEIEGARYSSGFGCSDRLPKTENGLACQKSGCGTVCSVNSGIDYVFATTPNQRYTATLKIADYAHNCIDKLSVGLSANGDRIKTYRGAGIDGWVLVTFDFTAGAKTTPLRVSLDNDICCGCNNTCNPTCRPLHKDLNLYVDSVLITPAP
jgi:hypothetical protein